MRPTNLNLIILAILAIWVTAVAVVLGLRDPSAPPPAESTTLIQGLDPYQIRSIVVSSGDDSVTLRIEAGEVMVTDRYNYPADVREVNDLLLKALDAKVARQVTDDAENHADLHVTEDTAKTLLKFLDAEGKLITGIALGEVKKTGDDAGTETYVRELTRDEVYLPDGYLYFDARPTDYMETKLLELDTEEIAEVTVQRPDETYTLTPTDEPGKYMLDPVPEGKTPRDWEPRQVAQALSYLTFTDVQRAAEAEADGLVFDYDYACRLKDGRTYRVRLGRKPTPTEEEPDAATWFVRCTAEFAFPAEAVEVGELALDQAQREAARFTQARRAWVYEISDYKAESLTRPLEELVEDAPEPATQPATQPTTAPATLPTGGPAAAPRTQPAT